MQKFPQIMLVLALGECNFCWENQKIAALPDTSSAALLSDLSFTLKKNPNKNKTSLK